MDGFDELFISEYWRLATELTIRQAALLIVGQEPSSETGTNCEDWKEHERPHGYEAVKQALVSALRKKLINGECIPIMEYDINGNECGECAGTTDINRSSLEFDSLVSFLAARNLRPPFFFPPDDSTSGEPDYLNPNHLRYSPKLAAAVQVWQAMEDENLRRGKGPISAMKDWLGSRYKELGLVYPQSGSNAKGQYKKGDRNDGAITQVATVANWNLDGGTPKTPTTQNPPPSEA